MIKSINLKTTAYELTSISVASFILILGSLWLKPVLDTASLWPANALIICILVRYSFLSRTTYIWLGIGIGHFLGQLAGGISLLESGIYSAINLSSMIATWYLLTYIWPIESLRKTKYIAHILWASLAGAGTSMLGVGLLLLLPSTYSVTPFPIWFFSTWLSYSITIPVAYLWPQWNTWWPQRSRLIHFILEHHRKDKLFHAVGTVLCSLLLSVFLGGPGAVIFPLPALIYCAFFLPQTTTAWLTLFSTLIVALSITISAPIAGLVDIANIHTLWGGVSAQLGLLLLGITPLLMSSSLAEHDDIVHNLNAALNHDSLTNALSRAAFMQRAEEYLQASPPAQFGNGLMMLDLDYFKNINDTHGHAAGDVVLTEFSRAIQDAIRPNDLLGRLGGEEFGVILPNTSYQITLKVAERLRQVIDDIRLYYDSEEPLRLTVSIGVVHDTRHHNASFETLLSHADQAMYAAKENGRNQVKVYQKHDENMDESMDKQETDMYP